MAVTSWPYPLHPRQGWSMGGSSPPSLFHNLCSVPFRVTVPSPVLLPKRVLFGGSTWETSSETRGATSGRNGDDPDAIGTSSWVADADRKGDGYHPQWGRSQFQGVRKRQREMRSLYSRARRPCCALYAHSQRCHRLHQVSVRWTLGMVGCVWRWL